MTCKARRQGDDMYCALCLKTWDADDPNPPECPEKGMKGRARHNIDYTQRLRIKRGTYPRRSKE